MLNEHGLFHSLPNEFIQRHRMLRFGRRVGIAVSGGADSTYLLHVLHALNLAAAILHVNHGLRGAESDADEVFVRSLGAELNLAVHVAHLPPGEGNIEQEARRARYRFFADRIAAGHCDAVATGHTLDDQAETVLTRFLRGAGTAGLSGVRPVTAAAIVRPLLSLRRTDIRAWLSENNIAWREDCSNSDTRFIRNRIRIELMPQLTELNPALAPALAATAEWAREEEVYWETELSRLESTQLIRQGEAILIQTAALATLPVAVQRRLLRRAIESLRGSLLGIGFSHTEAIRALAQTAEGSGRLQLPGLDVYRSFDWLRFAPIGHDSRLPRDFEADLAVPGVTALPERGIVMKMELVAGPPVYNKEVEALDLDRCAGPLKLRNWRPGDNYCPLDKSSPEKIKTMFQDARVPLWERRHWPVIVLSDSIVWARRFGVAREFAATDRSQRILQVRETLIAETMESKQPIRASIHE